MRKTRTDPWLAQQTGFCPDRFLYAVEHEGHLYVVYSNRSGRGGNRNSGEMTVIPIQALSAAN